MTSITHWNTRETFSSQGLSIPECLEATQSWEAAEALHLFVEAIDKQLVELV